MSNVTFSRCNFFNGYENNIPEFRDIVYRHVFLVHKNIYYSNIVWLDEWMDKWMMYHHRRRHPIVLVSISVKKKQK